MSNIEKEAIKELCHIIAYEVDRSPLRWADGEGNHSIYIHNMSSGKVCRVQIYEISLKISPVRAYYYVYFFGKYRSIAKEIQEPRIVGVTEAEVYKFISPKHVTDFVKEVVKLKERGGVLKDCKTEVVDRMERTKEVLMKKYKNAPHFKVNSITYSTSDIEVNAVQHHYMTIEAEILPGAYFTTAPKVELINAIQSIGTSPSTDIKDVIFNDPATIIIWADGSKTVVKVENEPFDPEKGLAMAISKRVLGNKYDYYDIFKKYVGRYEKKQKKGSAK